MIKANVDYDIRSRKFNVFYQSLVMNCVQGVMSYENAKKDRIVPLDLKLTTEEQEVLYYVSGYIVFALLAKYRRKAKRYCCFCSTVVTDTQS